MTSFTFYMYMYVELQIACTCISQLCKYPPERNQYVEINCISVCMGVKYRRNVTDSTLCLHSKNKCVINACLARCFLKSVCETHLSTSHSFSSTLVTFDCCLHQRMPLNSVQSLKLYCAPMSSWVLITHI